MHMYNFLCSDSLLYFFLFLSTLHSVYTRDCSCTVMATESPLCLGCSDAIPRTCDREYEKRLVVSVGQATITQTFPIFRN